MKNFFQNIFCRECGAKVELLTANQLKQKFSWLNTDGIVLGSYGYQNEGWFDPWALLSSFKLKAKEHGVHFIEGELHNVVHNEKSSTNNSETTSKLLKECQVHLPNGDLIPFSGSEFVIASGSDSGHIGPNHLLL